VWTAGQFETHPRAGYQATVHSGQWTRYREGAGERLGEQAGEQLGPVTARSGRLTAEGHQLGRARHRERDRVGYRYQRHRLGRRRVDVEPGVERVDEPFVADERAMLEGFLDWNRRTLLVKCEGLTGDQLAQQAVPPSTLSLLGLVRHVTDVERTWLRFRFGGERVEPVHGPPDVAFGEVDPAHAEQDITLLVAEWDAARRAVAGLALDHIFVSPRWGELSLRWAYHHMNGEYCRHNGHADLLRQRIDGTTGT